MNSADYFANQACWESSRSHRLQARVDALEEALGEAYAEIDAWKHMYMEDVLRKGAA